LGDLAANKTCAQLVIAPTAIAISITVDVG